MPEPTDSTLIATDAWRAAFPGATVGALVLRDVTNPATSPALEAAKRQLEIDLRADGGGDAERLAAYRAYYRPHGQTYHVKAQRQSVVEKGKPIPSRAALVEAMFMAELRNLILTAGHDLDALTLPLCAGVSRDEDRYALISGKAALLVGGDMLMADAAGIVSSVLRGPDRRSAITEQTRNVLFAVYAPAGIGAQAVQRHLEDVRANVELVAPAARTEALVVLTAS